MTFPVILLHLNFVEYSSFSHVCFMGDAFIKYIFGAERRARSRHGKRETHIEGERNGRGERERGRKRAK